jgi:hypothetical protein
MKHEQQPQGFVAASAAGKIRLPVTTPQATKLKAMPTRKQICARMTDPPMSHAFSRSAIDAVTSRAV